MPDHCPRSDDPRSDRAVHGDHTREEELLSDFYYYGAGVSYDPAHHANVIESSGMVILVSRRLDDGNCHTMVYADPGIFNIEELYEFDFQRVLTNCNEIRRKMGLPQIVLPAGKAGQEQFPR